MAFIHRHFREMTLKHGFAGTYQHQVVYKAVVSLSDVQAREQT